MSWGVIMLSLFSVFIKTELNPHLPKVLLRFKRLRFISNWIVCFWWAVLFTNTLVTFAFVRKWLYSCQSSSNSCYCCCPLHHCYCCFSEYQNETYKDPSNMSVASRYTAFTAHAPYCIVLCSLSGCTTFLRCMQWGIVLNVPMSSFKVPVILVRFYKTWIFWTSFWKILKYQIPWKSIQ
jgi:hypothetical protein